MLTPESLYLGQYCWNVTWCVVCYGTDVSTDRELVDSEASPQGRACHRCRVRCLFEGTQVSDTFIPES